MLSATAVPAVTPSRPAPASAVVPGMAWIPLDTCEWRRNGPTVAGGWVGTADLFRSAVRRVLDCLAEDGALPKGLKTGPDAPALVCMPNESSIFLTDNGDERPVTMAMLRAIVAELDRAADNKHGLYTPGEVAEANDSIRQITLHLASHKLRLGAH